MGIQASERVLHSDSEGDSSTLSWSSNGKRLVFSARKKNRDHIFAMVLDGNAGPKQLTEGDWDDIHPDCSRAPSASPASENEIRQVEEGSK